MHIVLALIEGHLIAVTGSIGERWTQLRQSNRGSFRVAQMPTPL